MANGKTLEMIQISAVTQIMHLTTRSVIRGNADHYHARSGSVKVHEALPPEFGDRRRYRAEMRLQKAEQKALRDRAREMKGGNNG